MSKTQTEIPKKPYQKPTLEQHFEWNLITAGIISQPVGIGQE